MFNYDGRRAQLARLSAHFSKLTRVALVALAVGLALVGFGFLYLSDSSGWILLGFAGWPISLLIWYRRHLTKLPIEIGDEIDQRLEPSVLAVLPRAVSAKDLAKAAVQSRSGQFMIARFGISPNFLVETSSEATQATDTIWRQACNIAGAGQLVQATHIIAALISVQTGLKQLLPHLQLDEQDIVAGASWYSHLSELIDLHTRPKRTGGIARDWTFGYTPLLSRFGTNITDQVIRGGLLNTDLEAHRDIRERMMQTFSSSGRQNVALVGPLGAGKTTIVYSFAEALMAADSNLPRDLKFRQVVSLDASALISSTRGRGELEELINAILVEAYKAKNIILCLDDALLFFEEGVGSVDLSSILLPVIEGGGLRMILTMDEQKWLRISSKNTALAAVLNRLMIPPASYEETIRVMQDQLISIEFKQKVTYMYQSLKEAYRLSERYLYDQSQPGKALRLLEAAAGYSENGLVTAVSVQRAIEQTQGIKIGGASTSDDDKQRLLAMEDLIHERMINQTRAVHLVSDALRRARAGVRNESRPIGTFLFLGPTGVGKTELAKSLAAVYFGGEDRLIRLDLNEFVGPDDVRRLIADGADDPYSLSAQVMKQPFSVILLDEIEKAHDSVLTTLLQVLDEGILRDIKGREVSFRDAIIIATSNAGSEQIRHHIDSGEELEQFEQLLVDELISSQQFRPEFLNRFDEIVLFRPLKPEELHQVVQLIIAGINKTLENQKIKLVVDEPAQAKLVELGYDPRLGARPLRRVVQRTVESVIAKRLLEGSAKAGDTLTIGIDDIEKPS